MNIKKLPKNYKLRTKTLKKDVEHMSDKSIKRYCTPLESLEESLIEMQEMRNSKVHGKTWRQLKEELKGQKGK